MKNFFLIALIVFAFSCSSKTEKVSSGDSMNGVNTNGIEDTTVTPAINGYAPPNAKTDTSQERKDSIDQRKQQ